MRCRLPAELPPSFGGSLVRSEYALVVSLCTKTAPQPGLLASLLFSSAGEWSRGPVHRLWLPVQVVCGAAYVNAHGPAPAALARCRLASVERPAGVCGDEDEDEDDEDEDDEDEDEDEDEEDEEEEEEDDLAAACETTYAVQLGTCPLARVELSSTRVRAGGALRGAIELAGVAGLGRSGPGAVGAQPIVQSLEMALVLTEQSAAESSPDAASAAVAPTTAPGSSTVVARMCIDSRAARRASFELALPLHAPPTATLGAAGLAVHLAYELRITFEARVPGEAAAASAGVAEAEADPQTSKLPWRLPVLVLPSPTRGRRAIAASARAAAALVPTVCREAVLVAGQYTLVNAT